MRRVINIPVSRNYNAYATSLDLSQTANSVVILGANGSGKTRFGSFVEDNNRDTHRITAQKSLMMPDTVNTTNSSMAEKNFLYGGYDPNQSPDWLETYGRKAYKYQNNPATNLTNDFYNLMTLLFSDEFEKALLFKENYRQGVINDLQTKLDKVVSIWERILPHRKLKRSSSSIQAVSNINGGSSTYNASQMSDGERVVFYLIAEAVCVKPESILIIDEPEIHIHKSIIKNLFDEIESAREDVMFVYLTHDIDFAVSRVGAYKLWLKSYNELNYWDYQQLQRDNSIPEEIYLEILGSRKSVLFVEGIKTSIDYLLYSVLYSDYTVTPVGGCEKVIEATKTFNGLSSFHHLLSKGIVDKDRRTDEDTERLKNQKVYVLQLAEVENLFLIEEVVKAVATHLYAVDANEVFNRVRHKVIEAFKLDLEEQVIEHTIYRAKKTVNQLTNSNVRNWSDLKSTFEQAFQINTYQNIYDTVKNELEALSNSNDFDGILKIANIKRLLERSELASLCGLANDGDKIRDLIINIIKSQSNTGKVVSAAMRRYIGDGSL